MKKATLIFTLLIMATWANARVFTVNNQISANDPGKYLYKTITDAHNAATAGDTLYIQGSSINYNTTTNVTKRLTLIGPGYLLDSNTDTQFEKISANVYALVFKTGSEESKVIGLSFYDGNGGITINTSSISVVRCLFQSSVGIYITSNSTSVSVQSILVHQCLFLWSSGATNYAISQNGNYAPAKNLMFSNNICEKPFLLQSESTGTLVNNTFLHNTLTLTGTSVGMTNNILMGTDKTKILLPPNAAQITYNISETDVFGTANGNKAFASATDLFVSTGTTDGKRQTKTTGPAHLSGKDGLTVGAFGGADPYRLSGLPPIPAIYELTTTGFGVQNGSLDITVKAKSN